MLRDGSQALRLESNQPAPMEGRSVGVFGIKSRLAYTRLLVIKCHPIVLLEGLRAVAEDYVSDVKPFSSLEEYQEHQHRRHALDEHIQYLSQLDLAQQRAAGHTLLADELDHMKEARIASQQQIEILDEYVSRLPAWLHARCPFCKQPVYWKIDPFDLNGDWWQWPYVPCDYQIPACEHLFCVDGALNLEGLQPTEVQNGIVWMASEVPFVKPRLLEEVGNVVAVIHRLPQKIAGKYTGYPIVYFGNPRPPRSEGSLGWARTEHHDDNGKWLVTYDKQDYRLDKWIARGKVHWLDPNDPDYPLVNSPLKAFPFQNIQGRRRPYKIHKGQVRLGYPADLRLTGP